MNITEFRQQHPEYAKIPDQQLADALYSKFYAGKVDRQRFDQAFMPAPAKVDTSNPEFHQFAPYFQGKQGEINIKGMVESPEWKALPPDKQQQVMAIADRALRLQDQSAQTEGTADIGSAILTAQGGKGLADLVGGVLPKVAGVAGKYLLRSQIPAAVRPLLGNKLTELEKVLTPATKVSEKAPEFGEGVFANPKPWEAAPKGVPSSDFLMGTKPVEAGPASPGGPIPAPMKTPAPGVATKVPEATAGPAAQASAMPEMTPPTSMSDLEKILQARAAQVPEINAGVPAIGGPGSEIEKVLAGSKSVSPELAGRYGVTPESQALDIQDMLRKPAVPLSMKDVLSARLSKYGGAGPRSVGAASAGELSPQSVDILKQAGMHVEGAMPEEQLPPKMQGKGALHYFTDPKTGSTLAMFEDELTPEGVQAHIAESRAKFGNE